uniref:C2H2-type domain-containing protein n=1 Tax=Knipowitschia caucasica TaxID=637954 RepID=A0AAV2MDI2_KNICA
MDEAEVGVMKEESQENVVRRDGGASGSEFPSVGHDPEGEGVFSCQKCGDAFTEEETYLQHLQQHALEHDGDCRETTDKTEADKSLPHIYSKDGGRNAQTTSKDLSEQTGITSQHAYKCEECGKTYGKFGYFINHQRTHMQPSKSVFHNLEHLEKKSFQCEYCGRSYSRMSALDAHRRCHEGKLVKKEKKCRSSPEALVPEQKAERKHLEADSGRSVTCLCGKKFSTLMKLNTHKRFSHNGQCFDNGVYERRKKGFKCSQCPKSFSSHVALASHEHSHKGKNYKCDECDKTFTTLYFYERHQGLKHSQIIPSKSFLHQVDQVQKKTCECKVCGLKFSRASALHAHELNHLNEMDETKLPQPGMHAQFERKATEQTGIRGFFSPESGTQAIKAEDDETLEPGDLIVKVISSSSSSSESEDNNSDLELVCESDYEIDYGEPGAEERLDCPDCYRCFTNPSSLRVHRMWHDIRRKRHGTQESASLHLEVEPDEANKSSESESSCNKRFASANSWIGHMKLHKERPFWCFSCARGFSQQETFNYHMYRHKCRKFQCTICNKMFRLLKQLNDHYNTHTGEKPHICTYCGKGFSQSASMYAHRKVHFKTNRTSTRTIRRLNNVERLYLQSTAQTLAGAMKQTPQSVEDYREYGRPVAKRLEWECCDCDQSFEEVTQLHNHYIQHAAGEIPML